MTSFHALCVALALAAAQRLAAQDDFPLTADSLPQPGLPQGNIIKDRHAAATDSVFPGTERDYHIYLPPGLDKTQPAPFMIFQDGVIYQAPTVFDHLIAKKEIPPLIGIFIRPGVVPAANSDALPRFNRSFEYDSITDRYARFLIDEFLPAIEKKHGLNLSRDPNARAIAGNSSGGICAFMAAWHRPDQFRRVLTGVGTYVGIHGADQLPVLARKVEPKPLRVFLQSGENDNNLYCGDWWLANQMMERSLSWNGYEVNHAWGKGGHNQKHASQIFPEVLRWLWKGYPDEPVQANPRGDAKWRGYEVIGKGQWERVAELNPLVNESADLSEKTIPQWEKMTSGADGALYASESTRGFVVRIPPSGKPAHFGPLIPGATGLSVQPDGNLCVTSWMKDAPARESAHPRPIHGRMITLDLQGSIVKTLECGPVRDLVTTHSGQWFAADGLKIHPMSQDGQFTGSRDFAPDQSHGAVCLALTPDQTQIYASMPASREVYLWRIASGETALHHGQPFVQWEEEISPQAHQRPRWGGICVDSNGWLYIATESGVQVCDQCGRVNFVVETPQIPRDICFGGKDLGELCILCDGAIYKRPTKARGCVSGQMAPVKPAPPKL